MQHKSRKYYLGTYKTKEEAVKIRKLAEEHRDKGDLFDWYENAFKNNPIGVYHEPKTNMWISQMVFQGKKYHFGFYESEKEAIEIRKQAEEHRRQGDLIDWHKENFGYNRKIRKDNTSGAIGVRYRENGNVWIAHIDYKSKGCYLGTYKTKEEAVKIRKLAEEHRDKGDLFDWYDSEFKKIKYRKARFPSPSLLP